MYMAKLLKSHYTNGYDPEEGESEIWGNEWIGNDEDEIIAFACFGDSEENDEVIAEIKKYKIGEDYILTRNKSSQFSSELFKEKYDEYQILNLKLRKELKKFIEDDEEDCRHLKPLKLLEPVGNLIEPIEPIQPIKPVGRPKENKKWREYKKSMVEYAERMKDYNQRVREYNKKVLERVQNIIKNSDKSQIKDLIRTTKTTTYKGNSQEKARWNWPAFWTGIFAATLIFSLVLIIARLFKKK